MMTSESAADEVTPVARPPHVVLLTTSLDVSGAERVMALVAEGLAREGYRVSVTALMKRSGALADIIRHPDVQVFDFGMSGRLDVGVAGRVTRWLEDEQVSVLYTFLYHSHVVGRYAGHRAGVPHIISSQQVANWGGPGRRALDRWTARWCDRIVAVSEGVRDDVVHGMRFPAEKVRTIYNAVEVDTFQPRRPAFTAAAPGHQVVIGSASRLAAEKDHESLIRGFALARTRMPTLLLRLAGSGPLAPHLQSVVSQVGLGDSVQLLGHVSDMRAFYETLDVYVQPSRTEGLPCAVVEAMAMERPVVATDVPGNRDAVEPGVTGWLIPPGSPSAWADALVTAAQNPHISVEFGLAGRRRAEALFDVRSMIASTVRLLDELVPRPVRPVQMQATR